MPISIKFDFDTNNLIELFDYFANKNIAIQFDKQELCKDLVKNKRFDEINFMLTRGYIIRDFLEYCSDDSLGDVCKFLLQKYDSNDNPVIDALICNNIVLVENLLKNGCTLETIKPDNVEQLFTKKCLSSIAFILNNIQNNKMPHLAEMDWSNCTKIIVKNGDIDTLKMMLDVGIDINSYHRDLIAISRIQKNIMMTHYLTTLNKKSWSRRKTRDDGLVKVTKAGVAFNE